MDFQIGKGYNLVMGPGCEAGIACGVMAFLLRQGDRWLDRDRLSATMIEEDLFV